MRVEAKWPDETGFVSVYTLRLPLASARGKVLTASVQFRAEMAGKVAQLYVVAVGRQDRFNDSLRLDTTRKAGGGRKSGSVARWQKAQTST